MFGQNATTMVRLDSSSCFSAVREGFRVSSIDSSTSSRSVGTTIGGWIGEGD